MRPNPPEAICIDPDDYHARNVGVTRGRRQFLLTTPFTPPVAGRARREFVALFLFDLSGGLVEAKIDDLGAAATLDQAKRSRCYEHRLAQLGRVSRQRIKVRPFSVRMHGEVFGLIATYDDDAEMWWVELQPGNYMAFSEPWDSGTYDT